MKKANNFRNSYQRVGGATIVTTKKTMKQRQDPDYIIKVGKDETYEDKIMYYVNRIYIYILFYIRYILCIMY